MEILAEVPDSLVKITPEKGIWKAEHTDYIKVIEAYLKTSLELSSVEKNKNLYEAGDEIGIYFSIAKLRKVGLDKEYHYSIKQSQKNNLKAYVKRYFAFGVGSASTIVLISEQALFKHIEKMKTYNKIDKADRWDFFLIHNAEYPKIKGTEFKLKEQLITSQAANEAIV
jgi:hypothetical protein